MSPLSRRSRRDEAPRERSRRLTLEPLEPRLYLAGDAAVLPADQSIVLDGLGTGRTFNGLGAVSAGGSSRLLFDYPEPARSDILDYLFKPDYGAGIQILKVEIGSDVNATDGSEPSHMRTLTDLDYDRGYEWWLMKEAKARNPNIILAGLEWGAPGWFDGGFWSQDNVSYIISWLDGVAQQGLTIDYVGGWNEKGFDPDWYVALDQALAISYPNVRVIAADDVPGKNWRVATEMANNPAFAAAVDVLGQHSPGGWRTEYEHYSSTPDAQAMNKPMWTSEQSAMSHDVGGTPWARGINRAYIDAGITASLSWAPISAWYANLPIADTGQILAEWPWSGYYELGSTVWAFAHTTQFAQPGWRYIDSASGYLESGASYVTLKSPEVTVEGRQWSAIIETLDATAPSTVTFTIAGGLSTGPVHVWSSDFGTGTLDDDFIQEPTIMPTGGGFTITLQPGHVYSLTTTTGQFKGDAPPPASVAQQMSLPFYEDFESYEDGELARYFSDINGGFETAPAMGDRAGTAYRQTVTQQPIAWNGTGAMPPTTMFGDPRWWGDYQVSADVLFDGSGYVELIGRVAAQAGQKIAGYHLQVSSSGSWRLYSQDLAGVQADDMSLASGNTPLAGGWNNVALRMQGDQIAVVINGQTVGSVTDSRYVSGNVALRVGTWQNVEFDNVEVTPTGPGPRLVPQDEMSITATSEHDLFYRGDSYPAEYAIDGRPESLWHARFDPKAPLPQSVTLDLKSVRNVEGLIYEPRIDNLRNGMITRYNIYLSADGLNFVRVVADGVWPISTGTKTANWPVQEARYVRLEAVDAWNGNASASEINVIAASAPSDFNADGAVDGADFLAWQRGMGKTGNATRADGDANGDLKVDGADLSVWEDQFNAASSALADVAVDTAVSASLAKFLPQNAWLDPAGVGANIAGESKADRIASGEAMTHAPSASDDRRYRLRLRSKLADALGRTESVGNDQKRSDSQTADRLFAQWDASTLLAVRDSKAAISTAFRRL